MWIVYASILIGVIAGTITGLVPGLHVNLVATMLVASATTLHSFVDVLVMSCFIIAMSVTHTFLDTIPSVFLGAPGPDTCLSVLPGHRFLLEGRGHTAVQLTVIGSLAALLLSTLLFPVFLGLAYLYPYLRSVLGYVLLAVALLLILFETEWLWAAVVFVLSGVLGYAVLNHPGLDEPLFPLLTGLFGLSTLGHSLRTASQLPEQRSTTVIPVDRFGAASAVGLGQFSGFLTAMLPGIGASTAAMLSISLKDLDRNGFMILIGSVNTVNFVLSLATFYAVEKARNGSVVAVQQLLSSLSVTRIGLFIGVGCVAGGIATLTTLYISKNAAAVFRTVPYDRLVAAVIAGLVTLCLILSGISGLAVLAVATAVGFIPILTGVKRAHAMGALILPVIVYFL